MQCVNRDDQWKDFYIEKMDEMPAESKETGIVDVLLSEKKAEDLYKAGKIDQAIQTLQKLGDMPTTSKEEQGWYLQEMARFAYSVSKLESNKYQLAAHSRNGALLKPKEGMVVQKLSAKSQARVQAIKEWMNGFVSAEDMVLEVDRMLDGLKFGVTFERFEQSLDELGTALGFATERPDRHWKAGPDNLWCIRDGEYLLFECKSEVHVHRKEIYKEETGQMNNSIAWFSENYPGCKSTNILIIPAKDLGQGAGFNAPVFCMRDGRLGKLRSNVRNFFREFSTADLSNLADSTIEQALTAHTLTTTNIATDGYKDLIKTTLH